jgi:hypothetical protein
MALTSNARKRARAAQLKTEWLGADNDIYAALGVSLGELAQLQHALEGRIVLPGTGHKIGGRTCACAFGPVPGAIFCESCRLREDRCAPQSHSLDEQVGPAIRRQ